MPNTTGLLGVLVLLFVAYALSTDRRRISGRIVGVGLALQVTLAFLFLRFPPVVEVFNLLALGVTRVISCADEGTRFIFGSLADASQPWGFVFAVKVLPVIIFFAAIMSALYHLGVMQRLVAAVAWVLRRSLGVTGAEALSAAANIFVGQTEAPLCVRPYIPTMTRSQLMAVMTGGFATIAGSVLAAYVNLLGGESEASRVLFAKHLMTASVMSAPAGFVMAKIMLPETETPRAEYVALLTSRTTETRNLFDALAVGASDGLRLALNVAAMLIAFVAVIALVNAPLSLLGTIDGQAVSLQVLLGRALAPLAWTLGIPWKECDAFGSLLGTQVVATEFVAYIRLAEDLGVGRLSERSAHIATYALCGFANLPSIAIQIGGLSAMAPERRSDLASLGLRAMVAGALACWMTGAVASLFIPA
ncbi:MAG: hypothetical protein KF745_02470 [Phycisphaeraceae bacterium]|nr:hypothetical protein [Phycisphaeraceae bacterium]